MIPMWILRIRCGLFGNILNAYVPGEGRSVPKPFYMETSEGAVKMLSKPTLKTKKISSLSSWLRKYAALPDGVADRTTWVAYTVTKEGAVAECPIFASG